MNTKTLSLMGLLSLAAGIMAIICYEDIKSEGVTIVAGIFFVVVGIVNLISFGARKDEKPGRRVMAQMANAGAIIFGICLLVFKAQLSPLVQWVFGISTALCAVWLLLIILFGLRPMRVPMWTLVFPVALAGCAVYILLQDGGAQDGGVTQSRIMLATGIALCLFGLGSLALAIIRSASNKALADKARREEKIEQKEAAKAEAQSEPDAHDKAYLSE